MKKLIDTVEEFKNPLDEQEIRGACSGNIRRAQDCIEARGGAFRVQAEEGLAGYRGVKNDVRTYIGTQMSAHVD